jgi:hypothetical protein
MELVTVAVETEEVTVSNDAGEGVLVTVLVIGEGVTVTGLKRAAQSEDLAGPWYPYFRPSTT